MSKSGGTKREIKKNSINKKLNSNLTRISKEDSNLQHNEMLAVKYSKSKRKKSIIYGEAI
jgi:hypothetical protein